MTITAHVDLRGQFGEARDQDPRPTCMAFAASDAHAAARAKWVPLSAEWAYYHALQRCGGPPDAGVTISAAMETLEQDGQPIESGWPYIAQDITDPAAWQPPTVNELFKRCHTTCSAKVDDIVKELEAKRPVVLVTALSPAFYQPQSGIVEANDPVTPLPLHALIAVGHGTRAQTSFILVRNSWGDAWGMNGYAWVSAPYLAPRLLDAAVLTTEP